MIFYLIGAGINTLISISDGLDSYLFRRKMEKARSMKEETDREVVISHQSRHSSFIVNMIKVLCPICTLIWRLNIYVSRHGTVKNRSNESNNIVIYICSLGYCYSFF